MLCQLCAEAIKAGPSRLPYEKNYFRWKGTSLRIHTSLSSLRSSTEIGCLLCRSFWDYCCEKNPGLREATEPVNFARFDWQIDLTYGDVDLIFEDFDGYFAIRIAENHRGVRFLLSPSCLDVRGNPIEYSEPEVSTRSSIRLWKYWYTACQRHHERCRSLSAVGAFKPTRLVEIRQDDPDCWNLIDETSRIAGPYATLSHCWGSSSHEVLKKENIANFKQRGQNLIAKLPQTFIDAIEVAKSLGIYYIWIDCLCIVQDDDDDWKEESAKMGLVYARAACNLAASCSSDSSGGFFRTRDLALVQLTSVDFGCDLRGFSTYRISNAASYDNDVANAPLNSRAWVTQERYLALRQLSFTAHQVYWECPELVANEQCPEGLPDELWNSSNTRSVRKRGMVPMSEASFRDTWSKIVEHYSSCGLTRKTDKLVALSGLATQIQLIQSQRPQSPALNMYVHGLWSVDFHQQLCWTRYGAKKEQYEARADQNIVRTSRLNGSIAPSWSWASLDGKVEYDLAYNDLGSQYRLSWIRVEDPEFKEGKPPAISKGLTLRGIALFGTLKPPYKEYVGRLTFSHALSTPDLHENPFWPSINPLESIRVDEVYWDLPQWPSDLDPSQELCFLMIYMDHLAETNHGLILQQIPSAAEPVEYVKLGSFKLEGAWGGDPGELIRRSDFMQHIAARQRREQPIEAVDDDALSDLESDMELESHPNTASKEKLFQRAERTLWIMDLDPPSMRDLVHTVCIR
ncbi:hypothetical protein PFICI_00281 [Pestalotiopsis fici W106-1]|uniref:Heterokaryon incompatibility domain-containing protein n=1 Tax=Pestalotiopsis fici (strain W106-1 / CGMCC3.15140) TaxID=1229662 RepID=W3XK81_PESFW|nr:uncharacterized protein PFICI_00281 [Pestalotiopsis fici W106-1]ETS86453.1 hypothetical protein PFICI_00281 [Pestalotiopsis fici W106-1]